MYIHTYNGINILLVYKLIASYFLTLMRFVDAYTFLFNI